MEEMRVMSILLMRPKDQEAFSPQAFDNMQKCLHRWNREIENFYNYKDKEEPLPDFPSMVAFSGELSGKALAELKERWSIENRRCANTFGVDPCDANTKNLYCYYCYMFCQDRNSFVSAEKE